MTKILDRICCVVFVSAKPAGIIERLKYDIEMPSDLCLPS